MIHSFPVYKPKKIRDDDSQETTTREIDEAESLFFWDKIDYGATLFLLFLSRNIIIIKLK